MKWALNIFFIEVLVTTRAATTTSALVVPVLENKAQSDNRRALAPGDFEYKEYSELSALEQKWYIDTDSWEIKVDKNVDLVDTTGTHTFEVVHGPGQDLYTDLESDHRYFEIYYDDTATWDFVDGKVQDIVAACPSHGGKLLGTSKDTLPLSEGNNANNVISEMDTKTMLLNPGDNAERRQVSRLAFRFGPDILDSDIFYAVPPEETDAGVNEAKVKFCIVFNLEEDDDQISLSSEGATDLDLIPTKDTVNYREFAVSMTLEFNGVFLGLATDIQGRPAAAAEDDSETLIYGVEAKIAPGTEYELDQPFVAGQAIPICACANDYPLTAVGQFTSLEFTTTQSTRRLRQLEETSQHVRHRRLHCPHNSFFGVHDCPEPATSPPDPANAQEDSSGDTDEDSITQSIIWTSATRTVEFDENSSGSAQCYNEVDTAGVPIYLNFQDDNTYQCCCWESILSRTFYDAIPSWKSNIGVHGAIELTIGPGSRQLEIASSSTKDAISVRSLVETKEVREFDLDVSLLKVPEDDSSGNPAVLGFLMVMIGPIFAFWMLI